MAKADIKNAFRILPVAPTCYKLLGFTWKSQIFYDKRLPMGASSSCATFEHMSKAIQWILGQLGVQYMSHILDDFIPLNPAKTVKPSTTIIVHGIQVNSCSRWASLPQDKIQKTENMLRKLANKRSTTLRELQSLRAYLILHVVLFVREELFSVASFI